jgi:multiple sugar transport system permease protein
MTNLVISRGKSVSQAKVERVARHVLVYTLLILGTILVMVPFAWTLSTSLKSDKQVLEFPPSWIPSPPIWYNYVEIFEARPFLLWYKNSLVIAAVRLFGQVLSSAIVAFGFARLRFKGRNVLFFVLLSTMMIPFHLLIVPRFVMFKVFGWLNTFKPMTIPAFFGSAFPIFLLRQYYMTIPLDLDDAAKIDGAGYLQTFWSIILPLAKPALGAVAIFQFMSSWRDFTGPLIYLSSEKNYTLPLGLYTYQADYFPEWNLFMAASIIAMILPIIVFLVAQEYFIGGFALVGTGGTKG